MVERREKHRTCFRRWVWLRLAVAAPWVDHKRIPRILGDNRNRDVGKRRS
jgi:hypothetical protein